jgi:hypothetical protein
MKKFLFFALYSVLSIFATMASFAQQDQHSRNGILIGVAHPMSANFNAPRMN